MKTVICWYGLGVLLSLGLLSGIGGCQSIESRIYSVTVENHSPQPVTVWLTKNGPVYENGWRSPEDLALESPKNGEPIAGVVVPAGRIADTGKVNGKFAPGTDAILRVYAGQRGFNDLLAMSRGNPDRTEVTLQPGQNDIVITNVNGALQATRQPTTQPAAK